MQGTSLEAYFGVVVPVLGARQREVLRVFIDNPTMDFTNMELAEDLGWSVNRVTPRVYELRQGDNPVLVEVLRRPCRVTGFRAVAWGLNPYWVPGGYKVD